MYINCVSGAFCDLPPYAIDPLIQRTHPVDSRFFFFFALRRSLDKGGVRLLWCIRIRSSVFVQRNPWFSPTGAPYTQTYILPHTFSVSVRCSLRSSPHLICSKAPAAARFVPGRRLGHQPCSRDLGPGPNGGVFGPGQCAPPLRGSFPPVANEENVKAFCFSL